jgi:Family of unknown function (DUF6353)
MNIIKIVPKKLVGKVSRQLLVAKKNSPHIFFGLGVAGTVVSAVLACRATLKLSETLDEIKKDVDSLEPIPQLDLGVEPVRELHIDRICVYGKASLRIVKLYGPAALVGAASIGALTGSHIQLARRNAALMAAYAAVQKAYDDYRDRVRAQLGEEAELELYHASRTELVNSDGKVTEAKIVDPNKYSPYAKFFDEFSPNWQRDPELNRIFVQCQQNWANHRLNAYGHIFLNEVYDALGIDRSRAGAVVGWVKNSEVGDGYIDFGIFEAFNSRFVNGSEQSILLDFNVDGVIYDKI